MSDYQFCNDVNYRPKELERERAEKRTNWQVIIGGHLPGDRAIICDPKESRGMSLSRVIEEINKGNYKIGHESDYTEERSEADREALERPESQEVKEVPPKRDIIAEGEARREAIREQKLDEAYGRNRPPMGARREVPRNRQAA